MTPRVWRLALGYVGEIGKRGNSRSRSAMPFVDLAKGNGEEDDMTPLMADTVCLQWMSDVEKWLEATCETFATHLAPIPSLFFQGRTKVTEKKKGNSETHPVPKSETNGWTYTWFKLLPSLNFPSPTEVTGFKMVCTNQNEWPWFWLKTALFWRVDPQN